MRDRLAAMEDRFAEIAEAIVQPEIIADQAKYQALLKEHAALSPAVEAWRHFTALQSQLAGAEELALRSGRMERGRFSRDGSDLHCQRRLCR